MNISVDNLIKRFDSIKSARSNWEDHWQDCADYCLPQKATITNIRSPGTKLKTDIYDTTAIQSAQIFAAGLHSYLTNPASRWFALEMKNKGLMDISAVKDWLKVCEDIIFAHFNSSNFNQVIHEDYIEFGIFGTSCLYEEEDDEDGIAFFVRPISEIYLLENKKGRIDTIYRSFSFTARQAYQQWGKDSGQKVLDLIEAQKVEEKLNFLHIILPREERDTRKKDARNMPFSSIYIEPTTRKILSEGGYEEFPFFIGRCYKVSDSEYAYSPASMSLADIKMLNTMSRDILNAAQKTLNPPVILPHDGYLLPFNTSAGAINYKFSVSPDDKVETLQINREINLSLEMENQRRASIRSAFFGDLFLMLAGLPERDRTATEIAERVSERMLILGPILGRLMHEKLDPIINRTFNILMRNKRLPPPPDEVVGYEYKVEYISPLAKAQRAVETKSFNDLMMAVGAMAQMNPEVLDNIDMDKIVKRLAASTNTADVLRSDDHIKALRAQRAQAIQTQQAIEQFKTGSEGAKTVAEAESILMRGGGEKGGEKSAK